jgi:uncharacterized membrane protein YhhN
MVIAVASLSLLAPVRDPGFSLGLIAALALSLGGDLALMFPEKRKAFALGLGFFLLAHIAYALVFSATRGFGLIDVVSAAVLLAMGAIIYVLFYPKLGGMRLPVLAYMLVISIMVNRAVSVLAGSSLSTGQGLMIALGAVLFYVSDIMLAANRFWKPWRYTRISLAFYYGGQALIALSASYFA